MGSLNKTGQDGGNRDLTLTSIEGTPKQAYISLDDCSHVIQAQEQANIIFGLIKDGQQGQYCLYEVVASQIQPERIRPSLVQLQKKIQEARR